MGLTNIGYRLQIGEEEMQHGLLLIPTLALLGDTGFEFKYGKDEKNET